MMKDEIMKFTQKDTVFAMTISILVLQVGYSPYSQKK